jgi:hypothetical protein
MGLMPAVRESLVAFSICSIIAGLKAVCYDAQKKELRADLEATGILAKAKAPSRKAA